MKACLQESYMFCTDCAETAKKVLQRELFQTPCCDYATTFPIYIYRFKNNRHSLQHETQQLRSVCPLVHTCTSELAMGGDAYTAANLKKSLTSCK